MSHEDFLRAVYVIVSSASPWYILCCVVYLSHRTLADTLELLEKQVQCPICLETYREPKALTCLHAYCQGCIQRLLLQQQRDQEVECPQCRSVVAVASNDPSSLPTVFFINGLIEWCEILKKVEGNEIACQNCSSEAKSTSFCHTCSMFICASCTDHHSTMKAFAGHETVLISDMRKRAPTQLPIKKAPISTCDKHEGEARKLHCFECKQLVCQVCALVNHVGHTFDFVGAVAGAYREETLSSLVSLHNTLASVTTAIKSMDDSKKEIRDQGTDIAATITKSFEEFRVIVNNHEQVLLQQVREVVARKVGVLNRQQEDLQLAQTTLGSLKEFIEKTVENASDEEFISMKQQMTSWIQQVSRKYQDVKLSPNEAANTIVTVPPPTSVAELCTNSFVADGPGLKFATLKQMSKFTVHTHDIHGQPHQVQQHVSAKLKSLVDGSVLQATVESQTPSTYELSYTPTTRGRHLLTVQVNNTEIGTFQVFVQHPPTQLGTPVRIIEGVQPMYVAVGDKGELCMSEHWDRRYTVLDAWGKIVLTKGFNIKPQFGDVYPAGIVTDGEGNVYVATNDHALQKFNRGGEVVKSVGKEGRNSGEFDHPWGVGHHSHRFYVCDRNNSRVQVFDSDLNFVQAFGTHDDGPGQLKDPRDIDFDTQGDIYVVDSHKHQVVVYNKDGRYLRHIGQRGRGKGELSTPTGLCVSGDYLYVTEGHNNRVSIFRTSGEFIHSFGKEGSGIGDLRCPWGIAIDKDGFVFVCDPNNSRIQVF